MEFNVYCDESCHLEHDNSPVMAIGGVYLPKDLKKEVNRRIIDIKKKYSIIPEAELKWTKISELKVDVYLDLIDYYFDDDDLSYRCIIAKKDSLNHSKYNQSHDDWYYKMYFDMLKVIFNPMNSYNIYIDIKDDRSYMKAQRLNEILCNSQYDFSKRIIKKVQPIRSEEVQIMQITDILTGAVTARNRYTSLDQIKNKGKVKVVERIMERSGKSLQRITLYREQKMNILPWEADYGK